MSGIVAAALFGGALMLAGAASATTLTFDIVGSPGIAPQDYGDRVGAISNPNYSYGAAGGSTPNVVIEYVAPGGHALTIFPSGYNDLVNVLENENDGESFYRVNFIADPGFKVELASFDMGNWGPQVTLPGFSIVDGANNLLYSSGSFILPASSNPGHLSFDVSSVGASQALSLIVDLTGLGGNSDNVGIDNIQFSQQLSPVPVPAALPLLGSALGALGLFRLRRKAAAG